jgi:hypothetical protein
MNEFFIFNPPIEFGSKKSFLFILFHLNKFN